MSGARAPARLALCAVLLAACSDAVVAPADRAAAPQFVYGGLVVSDAGFAADWPFAAALFSYSGQLTLFCTGSVIGQRWVLTAGHCIDHARQQAQQGRIIYVGVGSRDMQASMRFVAADQFTTSPDYDPSRIPSRDIGLIRLTADAGTSVAALPWQGITALQTVRSAGWGDTGAGISTRLRTLSLSVLDMQGEYFTASAAGSSLCGGDSGGPTLDASGTLVAVNSITTAAFCGAAAESGHALITADLSWITLMTGIQPAVRDADGPIVTQVAGEPVAVNAVGTVEAAIDESTTGNAAIASASLSIDGGAAIAMSAVDGAFDSPAEPVTGSFVAPATPGLYDACVVGADEHGNAGQPVCTLIAVYDPAAGFATGAGWIAAGADPGERAFFAFVARYRQGTTQPDGNTQFSFQAAALEFRSTSYDWLVVKASGAAQFKGTGTVEGAAGEFRFMLWAGDYEDGDTFRLKIWRGDDESDVIFDNGSDQRLLAGNIVVNRRP